MFSFFKKDQGAAKHPTVVHADVDALLVSHPGLPVQWPATPPMWAPRRLALDGVPPRAALLDEPVPGQTTTAFIIEGSGHAPLALVNIGGERAHIELWEMGPGEKPPFVRKKALRLDPGQDSWSVFLLSDVAYLPDNRLLLAVYYYAPHVKQGLFMYDIASDSYSKIADVVPHLDDRQKFFEAQLIEQDTVLVQYYTDTIRLAPEVYYNTPSHVRLYTPRYPQGIEILQLSAADGGIDRWTVRDRTLWMQSVDPRERAKPKEFIWSLNLEKVLRR